jgi:hypothetical protein
MRYVVPGQVPARIEVGPSNGLGASIHPDLGVEIDDFGSASVVPMKR